MKYLTLKARSEGGKEKDYSFIYLENQKDAEYFTQVNALMKSKQAISFWMGFKAQSSNFVREPMSYVQHEAPDNGMARLLSMKLEFAEKKTSIVDFCSHSDSIINGMNNTIFEYIGKGWGIRINQSGGYCPIKLDVSEYEKVLDINEQEMYNYLLHKDIKFKFEINKENVVIENDNYIPERLIETFCQLTDTAKNDIQIFSSFKHRTILFKQEDYVKFFNDGIKAGMKNVIFETTAQDQSQINKIKEVFEYLMSKHTDKTLNIYAKVYEHDKDLFQTKLKNINIIFI